MKFILDALAHWKKKDDGVTAIEFSLLVGPMIWIMLGTIEITLAFAASSNLEGAVMSASRNILTGQIQNAATPEEAVKMFEDVLCEEVSVFVDCDNIMYQVTSLGSGGSFNEAQMQPAPEFNDDGELLNQDGEPGNTFTPGGNSEIILIRVIYNYDVKTPVIGNILGGEDGAFRFTSSLIMQTEPYEFPSN